MSDGMAVIEQAWQPGFRHSAGRRGSHFIAAVRGGQLLGWKTARLGVSVPPGGAADDGEWVEVGPGATLLGFVPPGDPGKSATLAAIRVDGADTMVYAQVACESPGRLRAGLRLVADFAGLAEGSVLPVFVPAEAAS